RAVARLAFNHNTPRSDHAQLVFGIAHAPLAARSRPAAGEKLLTRVGEVVPHAMLGSARDQAVRRRHGDVWLEVTVETYDGSAHDGDITPESRGGLPCPPRCP